MGSTKAISPDGGAGAGRRGTAYPWAAGLLLGALLVGLTGTLATRKAVNEPPVAVLRDA